jgi:AcrR family transcriptional regulator
VPTGVAIPGVRAQLFDAAERVLLRAGADALTSRAVTTEAGVAKGVLHRHFADFDAFLAEFVLNRIGRMDSQAAALRDAAGTGTVIGNLTDALTALYGSAAVAMVPLVSSRESLRARLAGVPVLTEAMEMLASYLAAERELGRLDPDAEVEMLAPMLIGTVHLLWASQDGAAPSADEVRRVVTTAISGGVRRPNL